MRGREGEAGRRAAAAEASAQSRSAAGDERMQAAAAHRGRHLASPSGPTPALLPSVSVPLTRASLGSGAVLDSKKTRLT